ncbi:unnamed protein product [Prorocentrum cordatum]|uniref:Uncharacterized protein n=1 Tax=Prorocentrum cordatum TaxID=2364126 RepID=A0ABN9QKW8_9DINO|nr:unnamed protein product [Polarella glacialis]
MGRSINRGRLLNSWAKMEKMVVANTMFERPEEKRITLIGTDDIPKQLDYILVGRSSNCRVVNARSTSCLDSGSDHRAVRAKLCFTSSQDFVRDTAERGAHRAKRRTGEYQKTSFQEKVNS